MRQLGKIVGAMAVTALLGACGAIEDAAVLMGVDQRAETELPPPTNPPLAVPRDTETLPRPAAADIADDARSGSASAARAILGRAGTVVEREQSGSRD